MLPYILTFAAIYVYPIFSILWELKFVAITSSSHGFQAGHKIEKRLFADASLFYYILWKNDVIYQIFQKMSFWAWNCSNFCKLYLRHEVVFAKNQNRLVVQTRHLLTVVILLLLEELKYDKALFRDVGAYFRVRGL